MKFEIFLAHRLLGERDNQHGSKGISRLLSLSLVGVALSVMVMLLSVAIIQGFKAQVSSVAYSQSGHLNLHSYTTVGISTSDHITLEPSLLGYLRQQDEIVEVLPIVQQTAMIKTESDFAGLRLYGVDSGFSSALYTEALTEGVMPTFSSLDSVSHPLVLPSQATERLGLKTGQSIKLYFLSGDQIRVRAFTLVGIYNSHGLEQMPGLCPGASLRKLDKLSPGTYSQLMLFLRAPAKTTEVAEQLTTALLERPDLLGSNSYGLSTARELMPAMFEWLDLLDSNVVFLIAIMLLVGAFTMITGVIIVVLDKTEHIGLLKAIGATDQQVRRIFALIALRLIIQGMATGNLLALAVCWVQQRWQVIPLDPASYFMDAVPIHISPGLWLGINLGTLAFITLAIFVPTLIITRIKPADIMRID